VADLNRWAKIDEAALIRDIGDVGGPDLTPPRTSKERSAVEPVASALVLVDAGAVALEGADEGFAAEVADEAVDLAWLRGGDDFERQTWARFGFSSCVT
jgi:hypothetical protein